MPSWRGSYVQRVFVLIVARDRKGIASLTIQEPAAEEDTAERSCRCSTMSCLFQPCVSHAPQIQSSSWAAPPLQIGVKHGIGERVGNNAPYLIVQRPPWRATGVRSRTRAIGASAISWWRNTRFQSEKLYAKTVINNEIYLEKIPKYFTPIEGLEHSLFVTPSLRPVAACGRKRSRGAST